MGLRHFLHGLQDAQLSSWGQPAVRMMRVRAWPWNRRAQTQGTPPGACLSSASPQPALEDREISLCPAIPPCMLLSASSYVPGRMNWTLFWNVLTLFKHIAGTEMILVVEIHPFHRNDFSRAKPMSHESLCSCLVAEATAHSRHGENWAHKGILAAGAFCSQDTWRTPGRLQVSS